MINVLDNNADGNPICPKCNSDNVDIYEYCLNMIYKNKQHYSGTQSLHYFCLDCKYTSFTDKSLWIKILPDIIKIVKEKFMKWWTDYSIEHKKGDKFKVDSFEIEIK